MSAASFLGISALVFTSGYDGLIYSIGFLVGWPIILFLIAERLRNLGKYTFADVASYRLGQTQIRSLSACGSLVVVAWVAICFCMRGKEGGDSAVANAEVVVNPGLERSAFWSSVARLRKVQVVLMSGYISYLMNAIVD